MRYRANLKKSFRQATMLVGSIVVSVTIGTMLLHSGGDVKEYKRLPFSNNIELADTEIYSEITDSKGQVIEEEISYEGIDFTPNSLEEYIVGVVAAEMPVSFRYEALRAQAVAARTYTVRGLGIDFDKNNSIDSTKIGQAYISISEMKKRWGLSFDKYYGKVRAAVYSTRGVIIEYNGEPINAVFHSTSAGVTENAENVWGKSLPYIKSVESDVDRNAPNYEVTVKFGREEFEKKIKNGISEAKRLDNIYDNFKIIKRSQAGYVLSVDLGGICVKGMQIRQALGLRSTDFEINRGSEGICFVTKGYGHGVGMSQYGAEFMAREGCNYEQILKHYYSGINLSELK